METKVDAAMVFGLGDLKLDPMAHGEPSTGGKSWCDLGLHGSLGYQDYCGSENWRPGGVWRINAAVQQPSCGELWQPDKCILSDYNIFDI